MPKYILILIIIAALSAIASGIWVAIGLISEVSKSKAESAGLKDESKFEN